MRTSIGDITLDIDPGEVIWIAPEDMPGGGVDVSVEVGVGRMGEGVTVGVSVGVMAAAV